MSEQSRFTWAKLNADTLFLGLLAIGAGIFDLIDPTRDAVVVARDFAGPLFYVRAWSYLIAGLVLVVALTIQSVRAEALSRGLLIGGVGLDVYRHAVWVGWDDPATYATLVLFAIIAVTTHLRMSVLLGTDGLLIRRSAGEHR